MQATEFFQHPQSAAHKQYEALRAFYVERKSATEVAQQFGYTLSAFYSLSRDFKQQLKDGQPSQQFFITPRRGRGFLHIPRKGIFQDLDNEGLRNRELR